MPSNHGGQVCPEGAAGINDIKNSSCSLLSGDQICSKSFIGSNLRDLHKTSQTGYYGCTHLIVGDRATQRFMNSHPWLCSLEEERWEQIPTFWL